MSTPSSNTVSEPSASDAASSNDASSNGASSDADAPDVQPRPEAFEKLQTVLYEIFQFDVADLDFGIYRILNEKRKAVDRFIEDDLHAAVADGLSTYAEGRQEDKREAAVEAAERVRQQVADDAIVGEGVGELNPEYEDVQIKAAREAIADYREAKAAYEDAKVKAATENDIYNALARFFRRYYDDGDFVTQRRFKSGDSKYVVPYDGEEVMLHWANRDQYYVKTSEHFKNYRFAAQDYDVVFRLVDAQLPQDDVKESDSRYFVLHGDDPVTVDTEAKTCVITMAYRSITEEEKDAIVERYNEEEDESKSQLKRRMLCTTLEARILDAVDDARLTALLTAPKNDQAQYGRLYEHLNRYTAANTSDYFVHKDLKGFLTQQLDYFLKNEVLPLDDVLTGGVDADNRRRTFERAVDKAEVVRSVGQRIINFLAQIEDFQKRLFEKKKFVVDTGYCVTLDRVPEELYDAILESDGQLDEWRSLYALDETDDGLFGQGYQDGQFNRAFLETHPHAMIDTRHFDDQAFVDTLLAHLSDQDDDGIDGVVDGLCIQGENFQALNLLQEQFREKVQCVYIDPPYNTEKDDFLYKDNYRHSTWMSMMADRMAEAKKMLKRDGVLFSSIDDREYHRLTGVSNIVFGDHNHIASFIWKRRTSTAMRDQPISPDHDYVLLYGKSSDEAVLFGLPPDPEDYPYEDDGGRYASTDLTVGMNKDERPGQFYPITNPRTGTTYQPNPERVWRFFPETMEKVIAQDKIIWPDEEDGDMTRPRYKTYYDPEELSPKPVSTWIEQASTSDEEVAKVETEYLSSLLQTHRNEEGGRQLRSLLPGVDRYYPKPVSLVRSLVRAGTRGGHRVMDFFAGSGTTGQAVMNLNRESEHDRKYLLVEMGEYFNTLLLPRLKKVAFSSEWKEGVPQGNDGMSHVIQYHRLESYEDALNNIEVGELNPVEESLFGGSGDEEIRYQLDEKAEGGSSTLLQEEAFEHPFDYTLKIQDGMESPEPQTVDLEATFNYLIGLTVETRRVHRNPHLDDRRYVVGTGTVDTGDGIDDVMVVWRDREGLDDDALRREKAWFDDEVIDDREFDRVYVNGKSFIRGAEPVEISFREKM